MFHEKLIVYQESLKLAEEISKSSAKWQRGCGYLADQIKRAAASICLNVCEANGRESINDKKRFFTIAKGSAAEVSACLDLAYAFQLIKQEVVDYLKTKLIRIDRLLWGLIR